MLQGWLGRAKRRAWALTVAAALVVAMALAGGMVWAAVVSAPPVPPTPPPVPEVVPPYVLPPLDVTPPPTVYPSDVWGPQPVPTPYGTGLSTAGAQVTLGSGDKRKTVQLPSNVYVQYIAGEGGSYDCFLPRCPVRPSFYLAVVGGKSSVLVAGDLTLWFGPTEWDPHIAPGEEGVFDWLYEALGVAKGSEIRVELPPGAVP